MKSSEEWALHFLEKGVLNTGTKERPVFSWEVQNMIYEIQKDAMITVMAKSYEGSSNGVASPPKTEELLAKIEGHLSEIAKCVSTDCYRSSRGGHFIRIVEQLPERRE